MPINTECVQICTLLEDDQHFSDDELEQNCLCLDPFLNHPTPKTKATQSFGTSGATHSTLQHNVPQDHNVQDNLL